ncbi:MAG: biotin transporter BioY [Brevinema sp.]
MWSFQNPLTIPYFLINKKIMFITQIFVGSLIMATSAQIIIPFPFVPLTGQSLGLMIVALSMNQRAAIASIILYLSEGALGLPVFAGGTSIANLVGPTGGYLWGLIPSVLVISSLKNNTYFNSVVTSLIALLSGLIVLFGIGLLQLSLFVPLNFVLSIGLYPFLLGEFIKLLILALIIARISLYPTKN